MELTNKTASRLTGLMMIVAMLSTYAAANTLDLTENCFYNRNLVYTHDIFDWTGNFSDGKEYWLRKQTRCIIVQETNVRLEWFSSDLVVNFYLSYDFKDGRGCQPIGDDFFENFKAYKMGDNIRMGRQVAEFGQ